ncbi:putative ribonuclease H protein [Vitis vinifera]|uniref:Putative ribonuclease H protein n=1 Tax=Vitis vinifera TaxID=29760 RepID=A0A438JL19_VITVI|nr:putative ribonuclease H protein [Vitis vinifera]
MLEKKEFSPKWRNWMRGCLPLVSYAILVNGNAKGWVKASRGLRQGDPSSPFLFTIVVDVLSRMMLRAEERSLLEGFRVGNPITCGLWDPVIERISRRLDGWQKAYLSFGGRITLIHSCLSHIPSYFLSLFKIPALVVVKIERLQRDFLWSRVGEGKRDHLVSWDVVCKPRVKRGLGIGVWEDFFKESRSFREVLVEEMGKEFALEKICGGGPAFEIPISKTIKSSHG